MSAASVDLHWIPLGAGGSSVRFNGRVYEAIVAAAGRRPRRDLYHAALTVEVDGVRYAIEIAPSPDADEAGRGVVATGAVGSRLLRGMRLFRYEVRCTRGGSIPDLAYAVETTQVSGSPLVARAVLQLVSQVPTPVWGRDRLRAGEMWTSNSMIAWVLARAGVRIERHRPPEGGRAPGWDAGVAIARQRARKASARSSTSAAAASS